MKEPSRSLIIVSCVFALCAISIAQRPPIKRPVAGKPKPAVTAPPAAAPKGDQATASYNQGRQCAADAYDCRVAAFTKAIDLGLKTDAVYKERGLAYRGQGSYYKAILDLRKAITLNKPDISNYLELGSIYTFLNEPEGAENAYTAALAVDPKNTAPLKRRAALYIANGLTDDGVADLNRAIAIDPKDPEPVEMRLRIDQRKKNYDAVIADYTALIAIKPNEPSYYKERATAYFVNENYEAAAADYEKLPVLSPNDPDAYQRRAWNYQNKHQYDKARADFDKAVTLAQNPAAALIARAYFFMARNQTDEARADLTRAVEAEPSSARVYSAWASFYSRLEQHDKSAEAYTKAISLTPDDMTLYSSRAYAFLRLRLFKEALADCNKLIEAGDPAGYSWRSGIISETNGYEAYQKEAERAQAAYFERYTAMIGLEPQNYLHYVNRASHYPDNAKAKAVEDLTKALALKPDCKRCLSTRVSFLMALDRTYDALADANKLIELTPSTATSYITRISVHKKMGKMDLAVADASKAIELDPMDYSTWDARFSLYRYDLKDNQKALPDYLKVIEIQGRRWFYLTTLADLYADLGDFAAAERTYSEVISLKPKDPYRYFARALFYERKLNNKAKASEDYRRCAAAEGEPDLSPTDSIKKDCAEWARK